MMNIFAKEEEIIAQAEELLATKGFIECGYSEEYRLLLQEYKSLLKQMSRLVKMADMTQLELRKTSHKLEIASQTDALTGLHNRRSFNALFEREWKSAISAQEPLGIMMLDIDHFKKYNDTYGHLQGDECIIAVSHEIREALSRPKDIAARFGGDEFVLLLPQTGIEGACKVAERLLDQVRSRAIPHVNSPTHDFVGLSIGVASIVPDEKMPMDTFLGMADKALYEAKEERNTYRVHTATWGRFSCRTIL